MLLQPSVPFCSALLHPQLCQNHQLRTDRSHTLRTGAPLHSRLRSQWQRQRCIWGQPAALRQARTSALGASRWRVRPMAEEELFEAAEIQFEGFHEPQSFPPLNALARMTFRAEVVSTLKQKLQYNTPDRFACLVAERADGNRATVGIADVSIQNDKAVLRKLPEPVEQYAYLSSMAVDRSLRRQGAAQALLQAAERMAGTWKQRYLALHLYADNTPALRLYQRAGFRELDRVKPFMGRARVLMAKPVGKRSV